MLKFVANPVFELMWGTFPQKLILLPLAQVFQELGIFKVSYLTQLLTSLPLSVDFLLVHLESHSINFIFLAQY